MAGPLLAYSGGFRLDHGQRTGFGLCPYIKGFGLCPYIKGWVAQRPKYERRWEELSGIRDCWLRGCRKARPRSVL